MLCKEKLEAAVLLRKTLLKNNKPNTYSSTVNVYKLTKYLVNNNKCNCDYSH